MYSKFVDHNNLVEASLQAIRDAGYYYSLYFFSDGWANITVRRANEEARDFGGRHVDDVVRRACEVLGIGGA